MALEGLIPVIIGVIFCYLYIQEKDLFLKWIWVFIAFALFISAFFINYTLINTTTNSTVTTLTTSTISGVPLVCFKNASTYTLKNYYLESIPITGFNLLTLNPNPTANTNKTILNGQESGFFLLAHYETNSTSPLISEYPAGAYQIHIHASTNGSARLFTQLWIMNNTGIEPNLYMIGQSSQSAPIGNNITEAIGTFNSNYSYLVSPTDRLAVYVFANVTAFSQPLNITLYDGNGNNSHVSIPTLVSSNVCPTTTETSTLSTTTESPNTIITYNYNQIGATQGLGKAIGLVLLILVIVQAVRMVWINWQEAQNGI